jgi:hypothetical protein
VTLVTPAGTVHCCWPPVKLKVTVCPKLMAKENKRLVKIRKRDNMVPNVSVICQNYNKNIKLI